MIVQNFVLFISLSPGDFPRPCFQVDFNLLNGHRAFLLCWIITYVTVLLLMTCKLSPVFLYGNEYWDLGGFLIYC